MRLVPLLADIFLMTAIVEERQAGYSDEDAVSLALQRSGPVISWAGAIMAVAYSGFLFSHIPLLNQVRRCPPGVGCVLGLTPRPRDSSRLQNRRP